MNTQWTGYQALQWVQQQALQQNAAVVLMGEAVGALGGIYHTSEGLLAEFGDQRVIETPFSESAALGVGSGMALAGKIVIWESVGAESLQIVQQTLKKLSFDADKPRDFMPHLVLRLPCSVRGYSAAEVAAACFDIPGVHVLCASGPNTLVAQLQHALHNSGLWVLLEPEAALIATEPQQPATKFEPIHTHCEGDCAVVLAYGTQAMDASEVIATDENLRDAVAVATIAQLVPLPSQDLGNYIKNVGGRALILQDAPGNWGALCQTALLQHTFWHMEAPIMQLIAPEAEILTIVLTELVEKV